MDGGEIKGTATITLPSAPDFINDGIISPGSSPGELTLEGDYVSSATTNVIIELNGYTQSVDYDLLNIDGDAALDGGITVVMGFDASVNDEFVIVTTTGTINTCNLPATISASYNSTTYNFDVFCRNDNELVLRIDSTLGINDASFDSQITLKSNPISEILVLNNRNSQHIDSLSIFDLNGRLINTYNVNNNNQLIEIPLTNIRSGLYFIKITSENRLAIKKFIKI